MSDFTGLRVILDATSDKLPGLPASSDPRAEGRVTAVGGIPDGTSGGRAAVALVITFPDGSTALAQTTLALLSGALSALTARYPDPRP
jgi:hypothetical protein